MDFGVVINQILVLFIVLFTGLIIRKRNIIDDHSNKKISSLVVNVTAPILIIGGMIQQNALNGREFFGMLAVSVLSYVFLFALTIVIPKVIKVPRKDLGIYKFMIMFSNVGFMGFPVVSAVFGEGAIFYAAIFNLPFSLLVYTLGINFISNSEDGGQGFDYKKLINPGVISVVIGLVILGFQLNLPTFLTTSIQMIGGLTTPLSMIVIGASLSGVKVKTLFSNSKLYIYSFIKLVMIPLITLVILKWVGIEGMILGVASILAGMPVAANAVILSNEYGGNDTLASEGVFISTMLSIITIPFIAYMITL